jgi:hypothetical protein
MVIKLLIGKRPVLFQRFPLPDQRNLIASPGIEVSVEAIITRIELPAVKPFDFRLAKVPFQYLVPFLFPVQLLRKLPPKLLRILNRLLIQFPVLLHGFNGGFGLHRI